MPGWECSMEGICVRGDKDVYRPGEDSLLLLSHIIRRDLPHMDLYIDFGCGSGIQAIGLGRRRLYTLALDIDFRASKACVENSARNGVDGYIDVMTTPRYLDMLREDLSILVVCNPPYLPVDQDDGESIAWAGGEGGLETVISLINSLSRFKHVEAYIVLSSYTDLSRFKEVCVNAGFRIREVDKLIFPNEHLYLFQLNK